MRDGAMHGAAAKALLRCAIGAMVAAALVAPSSAQRDNAREVPFETSQRFGLVLVKVEINGKPATMIVDTGSNHTVISSAFAEFRPRTLDSLMSTGRGSGFSGTGVFAKVTLKVGPIAWRDHSVVVMGMHSFSKTMGQQVDGLLGFDFLSEFQLVAVDVKNKKLILYP